MILSFIMENQFHKKVEDRYFKYFYKAKKLQNNSRRGIFNKLINKWYTYKMYKIQRTYNCFIPCESSIASMPIFPHGLNGVFISGGYYW